MTSSNLAHNKSSLPTTPSTFPVIKRYGTPYALVNPGSKAENVLAIVDQVMHAVVPAGYRELDDVIRDSESNPRRAAARARARLRLAAQVANVDRKATIASMRLKSGLSQAKVAELLGNSQSGYSMIESGKRGDVLLSTFERLVEIFGVTREELAEAIKNSQEKIS